MTGISYHAPWTTSPATSRSYFSWRYILGSNRWHAKLAQNSKFQYYLTIDAYLFLFNIECSYFIWLGDFVCRKFKGWVLCLLKELICGAVLKSYASITAYLVLMWKKLNKSFLMNNAKQYRKGVVLPVTNYQLALITNITLCIPDGKIKNLLPRTSKNCADKQTHNWICQNYAQRYRCIFPNLWNINLYLVVTINKITVVKTVERISVAWLLPVIVLWQMMISGPLLFLHKLHFVREILQRFVFYPAKALSSKHCDLFWQISENENIRDYTCSYKKNNHQFFNFSI